MTRCRQKQCNTCWIRRQLIGVGAAALGVYWGAKDTVTMDTALTFALLAVIFLLVVRHEDVA